MSGSIQAMIVAIPGAEGATFVELSRGHIESLVPQAREHLGQLGFVAGDMLLLTGTQDDGTYLRPYAEAANAMHGSYTAANLARFARPNLIRFFQLYTFRAVFGLGPDIVRAVESNGIPFGDVAGDATVFAEPEAGRLLDQCGVAWLPWITIGPLAATGCRLGEGAHVMEGDWTVGEEGGALVALGAGGARIKSGRRGRVERSACGCGRSSPRVWVEA